MVGQSDGRVAIDAGSVVALLVTQPSRFVMTSALTRSRDATQYGSAVAVGPDAGSRPQVDPDGECPLDHRACTPLADARPDASPLRI